MERYELSHWTDRRRAVAARANEALARHRGMPSVYFVMPPPPIATFIDQSGPVLDALIKTCEVTPLNMQLAPDGPRLVARFYDAENDDTFYLSDIDTVLVRADHE